MVVTQVHRRVGFKQKACLKHHFLGNTKERAGTDNETLKEFHNILITAFHVKRMKKVRVIFFLTSLDSDNSEELYKLQSEPSLTRFKKHDATECLAKRTQTFNFKKHFFAFFGILSSKLHLYGTRNNIKRQNYEDL